MIMNNQWKLSTEDKKVNMNVSGLHGNDPNMKLVSLVRATKFWENLFSIMPIGQ